MNEIKALAIDEKVSSIEKKRIELLTNLLKKIVLFSFICAGAILLIIFVGSLIENPLDFSNTNIQNTILEILIHNLNFNEFVIVLLSSLFMSVIFIGLPDFKNLNQEYNSLIGIKILPRDLEFYDLQLKGFGRIKISSWGYPPPNIQQIIENFFNKSSNVQYQQKSKDSYISFNRYFIIEVENKKLYLVSFSKYISHQEYHYSYRSRIYTREFSCITMILMYTKSELTQKEDTIKPNNPKVKFFEVEDEVQIYRVFYYYIKKDEKLFNFSIFRKFTRGYLEEEIEKIKCYLGRFFYYPEVSVELID